MYQFSQTDLCITSHRSKVLWSKILRMIRLSALFDPVKLERCCGSLSLIDFTRPVLVVFVLILSFGCFEDLLSSILVGSGFRTGCFVFYI